MVDTTTVVGLAGATGGVITLLWAVLTKFRHARTSKSISITGPGGQFTITNIESKEVSEILEALLKSANKEEKRPSERDEGSANKSK
jgi:hypothetical protein